MFDVSPSLDGLYSVCVFNAEDLSDEQIQESFCQFGEIIEIHRAKNIVFLRYYKKEDALMCLESMQNHSKFNVRPAKQKITPQENQQVRSPDPKNTETMTHVKRHEGGGRRSDGFIENRNGRDEGRRADEIPPLPDLVEVCVPEPPLNPYAPKSKIVVIANLPAGFKQRNVYKICSASKGDLVVPLHVAMKKINIPPEPEVRYAYVYFKTEQEVSIVVEHLDDLSLNGNSLVVKEVDKLLDES